MRVSKLIFVFSGFFLVAALSSVSADTIKLQNDQTLEGKVEILEDGSVKLNLLKGGSVTFSKKQVKSIEYGLTALEQYRTKRAAIPEGSASSHFILGLWCRENGLTKEAEKEFRSVIKINPDQKTARKLLGYIKVNDKWITKKEFHLQKGEVFYGGRWISAEEKEKLVKEKKAQERLKKLVLLIDKASRGKGKKAAEALAALNSQPKEEVGNALIHCLDRGLTIKIFSANELANRKVKGAEKELVKLAIEGQSKATRAAGLKAIKKLKADKTWYYLSKYLYSPTTLFRIYTLQTLLFFKDFRCVPYILHSFPLAWAGMNKSELMTNVNQTYVRGYEVVPRDVGVGLGNFARPLIGGIQIGAGLSTNPPGSDERKRRAEIFLRFKALEVISGKTFGPDLEYWLTWWNNDGKIALDTFMKTLKEKNKHGEKPIPKSSPPPSLPD